MKLLVRTEDQKTVSYAVDKNSFEQAVAELTSRIEKVKQ